MLQAIQYWSLLLLWKSLRLLPYELRRRVLNCLVRLTFILVPRLKRISNLNLRQAFPDLDQTARAQIYLDFLGSLATLLADFTRIPELNREWVDRNVELDFLDRLDQVQKHAEGKGILLATGHLGSFELVAQIAALLEFPIAIIVRRMKHARIDRFYNDIRAIHGNQIIYREGAYREMVRAIRRGSSVGVLFDQNVTRNFAVFADWFGKPAATTKALAMAALRTGCPILTVGLVNRPGEKYRLGMLECDYADIAQDSSLSKGEKIEQLTARVSQQFQELIRENPGGWFWMHRRWRTAPDGVPENFYAA